MVRKSVSKSLSSATATTAGSAAAAQPALETKTSRSKPAARSRKPSVRSKAAAAETNGHELSSIHDMRDHIARLAYDFWVERGCTGGSPEEDWFRAESELKSRHTSAA
jgi:hypothetical protein